MSVEVSPPFVLAPPFVEHPAAKSRRHAPPPPRANTRVDSLLDRIIVARALWLTPVLLLQAVLSLRLTNGLSDDEALSINAGHQMIAHLLHGAASPAFGSYFAGLPALYAVPAAMLDHVGGPDLVRGFSTVLVLAATVLLYVATRRTFGQGAAIFAAAIFAINPTTIFAARYASPDALCLLTVTAALFFVTKAAQRPRFAVLAGVFLATAAAEKYVVALLVPGAIAVAAAVCGRRTNRAGVIRAVTWLVAGVIGGGAAWAAVGHADGQGFAHAVLGGRTLVTVSSGTLLLDGWDYLGLIAIASIAAGFVLAGRRTLVAALCVTALTPVVVQIACHQPAALQRNVALTMVFLAPVLGALAVWLVAPGRLLGMRAVLAVLGGVAMLSSGMGTSASMIHSWPTSTSIDGALRYYAHVGTQRYLVDGSDLPAYYLSDVTNYSQWASTLDRRYMAAGGATRLREDLESAEYRLVLYRNEGATPALDESMLATLRTRYTLVAKVPVIPGKSDAYWSLWLAEMP